MSPSLTKLMINGHSVAGKLRGKERERARVSDSLTNWRCTHTHLYTVRVECWIVECELWPHELLSPSRSFRAVSLLNLLLGPPSVHVTFTSNSRSFKVKRGSGTGSPRVQWVQTRLGRFCSALCDCRDVRKWPRQHISPWGQSRSFSLLVEFTLAFLTILSLTMAMAVGNNQ